MVTFHKHAQLKADFLLNVASFVLFWCDFISGVNNIISIQ